MHSSYPFFVLAFPLSPAVVFLHMTEHLDRDQGISKTCASRNRGYPRERASSLSAPAPQNRENRGRTRNTNKSTLGSYRMRRKETRWEKKKGFPRIPKNHQTPAPTCPEKPANTAPWTCPKVTTKRRVWRKGAKKKKKTSEEDKKGLLYMKKNFETYHNVIRI